MDNRGEDGKDIPGTHAFLESPTGREKTPTERSLTPFCSVS